MSQFSDITYFSKAMEPERRSSASDHAGRRTAVQRDLTRRNWNLAGNKVQVTCVPVSVYEARITADGPTLIFSPPSAKVLGDHKPFPEN